MKNLLTKMMLIGLSNEEHPVVNMVLEMVRENTLNLELGVDAVDTMRKVKMALDPNRIMNPDKVF